MKQNFGFTLVELMIVIVIIGVLAAFALPAYTAYTMRAARGDGQQLAMSIMAAQEQYFIERARYTDKLTDAAPAGLGAPNPVRSEAGHFDAVAEACPAPLDNLSQCVRVRLVPVTKVAEKVDKLMGLDIGKAGKPAEEKNIFLQSNGMRSWAWDAPITRDPG